MNGNPKTIKGTAKLTNLGKSNVDPSSGNIRQTSASGLPYGVHEEDWLAGNQGNGSAIMIGLGNAIIDAIGVTVATPGYLYELGKSFFNQYNDFENALVDAGDAISGLNFGEVHLSRKTQEKWFGLLDAEWWAGTIEQMGPTISMLATSYLTGGLSGMAISRGLNTAKTLATGSAKKAAAAWGRYKLMTAGTAALTNRFIEGSMEAYENFQATYDSLKRDNPNMSEEDLRLRSGRAARDTFIDNMPLLLLDYFQYKGIFGGLSKMGLGKGVGGAVAGGAAEILTEGFEEGYQYAVSNAAQHNAYYATNDRENRTDALNEFLNLLGQRDPELWKSIGQGMAGGAVFTGLGELVSKLSGIRSNFKSLETAAGIADAERILENFSLNLVKNAWKKNKFYQLTETLEDTLRSENTSPVDKQRAQNMLDLANKYKSDMESIADNAAKEEQLDSLFRQYSAKLSANKIKDLISDVEEKLSIFIEDEADLAYTSAVTKVNVLKGLTFKNEVAEKHRKELLAEAKKDVSNLAKGKVVTNPFSTKYADLLGNFYRREIDGRIAGEAATDLSNPNSAINLERQKTVGEARAKFENTSTPQELQELKDDYSDNQFKDNIYEEADAILEEKANEELAGNAEPNADASKSDLYDFYTDKPFAFERRFPGHDIEELVNATPKNKPTSSLTDETLSNIQNALDTKSEMMTRMGWGDKVLDANKGADAEISDIELVELLDRGLLPYDLYGAIAQGGANLTLTNKVLIAKDLGSNYLAAGEIVAEWKKLKEKEENKEAYHNMLVNLGLEKPKTIDEAINEEVSKKETGAKESPTSNLIPENDTSTPVFEEPKDAAPAEQFIESYHKAQFKYLNTKKGEFIQLINHRIDGKNRLTFKEFKALEAAGKIKIQGGLVSGETNTLYDANGMPVESSFAKEMGIDTQFLDTGEFVTEESDANATPISFQVDHKQPIISKYNADSIPEKFIVQVVYTDPSGNKHVIGVLKDTEKNSSYTKLNALRKILWENYQASDKTGVVDLGVNTKLKHVHSGQFFQTKNYKKRISLSEAQPAGMPIVLGANISIDNQPVMRVNSDAMPEGKERDIALELEANGGTVGGFFMAVRDKMGRIRPFKIFVKNIKSSPDLRDKLLQAIANFRVAEAREIVRFKHKYTGKTRPDFNEKLETLYSGTKVNADNRAKYVREGAIFRIVRKLDDNGKPLVVETVQITKKNKDGTWQHRIWVDGATEKLSAFEERPSIDIEAAIQSNAVTLHYAYAYYSSYDLGNHQRQIDARRVNTDNYNAEIEEHLEVDAIPGQLFHSPGFAINLDIENAEFNTETLENTKGEKLTQRPGKTETAAGNQGKVTFSEMKKDGDRLTITEDKEYYEDKDGERYSRVSNFYKPANKKNKEGLYPNMEDVKGSLVQASVKWGNKIDNFIRDWFMNPEASRQEMTDQLEREVGDPESSGLDKFISDLIELENWFASRGETVFTDELILSDPETRVAGTVDIITVDKQGQWRIYDLKTMRTNHYQTGSYDKPYIGEGSDGLSYKGRHLRQLSTYRMLLAKRHGIHAVEVGIIPIALFYDKVGTALESINFANLRGFSDTGLRVEELDPNRDAKTQTTPGVVLFEPLDKIKDLEMPSATGDPFLDAAEEFSQTESDRTFDMNDRQRVVLNKAGIAYKAQHKVGDNWKDYAANSSVQKRLIHAHTINKKLMQVGAANATLVLLDGSEVRANPIMAGGFDVTQGVMAIDGNIVDYSAIKDVKPATKADTGKTKEEAKQSLKDTNSYVWDFDGSVQFGDVVFYGKDHGKTKISQNPDGTPTTMQEGSIQSSIFTTDELIEAAKSKNIAVVNQLAKEVDAKYNSNRPNTESTTVADIERRRQKELKYATQEGRQESIQEGRENTKEIFSFLLSKFGSNTLVGKVLRLLTQLIDLNKFSIRRVESLKSARDGKYVNGISYQGGVDLDAVVFDGVLRGDLDSIKTLVHELFHAVLNSSEYNAHKRGETTSLSASEIEAWKNLERLYNKARAATNDKRQYGYTNLDEFLAEAFSNTNFQNDLRSMEGEGKKTSLFKSILDGILSLFKAQVTKWAEKFNKPAPEVNSGLLEDVMYWAEQLIKPGTKVAEATTVKEINAKYDAELAALGRKIEFKNEPKTKPEFREIVNIYYGANENAELSNFAKRPFDVSLTDIGWKNGDNTFDTVEGAFQAYKLYFVGNNSASSVDNWSKGHQNLFKKLQKATGAEAKRLGRQIKGLNVKEWDATSPEIMKDLILKSFEQNPEAKRRLIDTKNAKFTHTQDKGKWGTLFPAILEEVRSDLQEIEAQETMSKPLAVGDKVKLPNDPRTFVIEQLSSNGKKASIREVLPDGGVGDFFPQDVKKLTRAIEQTTTAKPEGPSKTDSKLNINDDNPLNNKCNG